MTTQESIRAEMNAFLDQYELFEDIIEERIADPANLFCQERIALFAIYMSEKR